MWDEQDGFFYDVLRLPDGRAERLKVRSMVGLLPLCAVTVFDGKVLQRLPELTHRLRRFLDARPELTAFIHDPMKLGHSGRRLGSILDEKKLRRVQTIMLDEKEFLGAYGIRALSHYHAEHPYVFRVGDQEYRVSYLPAESDSGMFGGNSNWRGPIWMPVNALIIRALLSYYTYYGKEFTIECPTGSGHFMNLYQVAEEIARRLASIFLQNADGTPPVYGGTGNSRRIPTGATVSCSTSISTATTALDSAPVIRPAGPDSLPGPCISSRPAPPTNSSSLVRPPPSSRPRQRPGRRRAVGQVDMGLPLYPVFYQVNTRVWLTELSRTLNRPATLDDIPDTELASPRWDSTGSGS
jgi:hypothetical protein